MSINLDGEVIRDNTFLQNYSNDEAELNYRNSSNYYRYYKSLNKISKYLYIVDYDDYDIKLAEEYFKKNHSPITPRGCSSIRKDNYYGRNFDWFYNNDIAFIIRTSNKNGRYATIGTIDYADNLTTQSINDTKYNEVFSVLPYFTVDGMNEKGLTANLNVVPAGDMGITVGTTPLIETRHVISDLALVRFILDNFENCIDAINYIKNYMSVFCHPNIECHIMLADSTSNYCIEFIDNQINVIELSQTNGLKPIMTNFYLTDISYTNNKLDWTTVTPHGMGLERYDILMDSYSSIDSLDDMIDTMISIKSTNSYDSSMNPFWYSEYVGSSEQYGELTISDILDTEHVEEKFSQIVSDYKEKFDNRSRDKNSPYYGTWQTTHMTCYDMNQKIMKVCIQEEFDKVYTIEI